MGDRDLVLTGVGERYRLCLVAVEIDSSTPARDVVDSEGKRRVAGKVRSREDPSRLHSKLDNSLESSNV